METLLRLLQLIMKIIYRIVYPVLQIFLPIKVSTTIPVSRKDLCHRSLREVIKLLREQEIEASELVNAYIMRITEVDNQLNAVVDDRFADAQKDAKRVDEMIANTPRNEMGALFERYPLLGVPFTVKEACGLQGMSFVVGSNQRRGLKCEKSGDVVETLIAAGAIPLCVSANPEYCFSIETNPKTSGTCLNPYDCRRTPGGSSGGEGALQGAGASLFGVGSDIAGSIRIPALFNCVFGHKPTPGLISAKGHFPNSSDPDCETYLQVGPMTRFGRDLSKLMEIMAGKNAEKLNLKGPLETTDIKIYYSLGFDGLNGLLHTRVDPQFTACIHNAVKFFKQRNVQTKQAHIKGFQNSLEMSFSALVLLKDFPYVINSNNPAKAFEHLREYIRSLVGKSPYSKDAIYFDLLRHSKALMTEKQMLKYKAEAEVLKKEIISLLGENGVLFFPTFHVPAIHHNTSHLALWGIDYTMIFNILGLPATHIPMGLNRKGIPVGFQVIAAPYQDRLCFQIAREMEYAFGGWCPPKRQ